MKKLLFFPVLLLIFIHSESYSQTKTFALGFEGTHYPHLFGTPDSLKELSCNLWQGWDAGEDLSWFLPILKSNDFKYAIFQPKNTVTRSWGQQTVYQAEVTDINSSAIEKYKYNNHWSRGTDITDNGKRVRYYETIPSNPNPGYILTGADEFFEQTGSIIWWQTNQKYLWWKTETDSLNRWYIMPRMRIDSAFAKNNPNVDVAKIEIYSYDTTLIRTAFIKCENFYDVNLNYDGRYLEEFSFGAANPLEVSASAINGLNKGRKYNEGPVPESCGVDFRIYWYETTNLWIDYVKVEDKYAHELFKGFYNELIIDGFRKL